MKIAAVTDDGVTLHSHFGQATKYEVVTIENGQVVAREQRAKPSHQHGAQHLNPGSGGDTHASGMAHVILDCQVLLARGMGQPAYDTLSSAGIQPILTEKQTIDEAVQAYVRGELTHRAERIHHK
ncbi:MAG: dinitrogenase iron-molybdenum cofactor biosynthesis protein [Chloroflexi bacterium]|nr:dinitrogenase iron-molybdenum cofactor biosynthesis protein [Chloroflexota bacterium]